MSIRKVVFGYIDYYLYSLSHIDYYVLTITLRIENRPFGNERDRGAFLNLGIFSLGKYRKFLCNFE